MNIIKIAKIPAKKTLSKWKKRGCICCDDVIDQSEICMPKIANDIDDDPEIWSVPFLVNQRIALDICNTDSNTNGMPFLFLFLIKFYDKSIIWCGFFFSLFIFELVCWWLMNIVIILMGIMYLSPPFCALIPARSLSSCYWSHKWDVPKMVGVEMYENCRIHHTKKKPTAACNEIDIYFRFTVRLVAVSKQPIQIHNHGEFRRWAKTKKQHQQ